jgi:imidazolonepropionase-like amidohydrolase
VRRACLVALLAAVPAAAPEDPRRVPSFRPETVLVRHATIWTQGPQGVLQDADLLVRGGKVVAVGRGLQGPPGAHVVEAAGKHVTPGLVDCHSHSAIRGGVNEGSDNVTAEVRVADVLEPDDESLYRELAGGLTTAHLLHGSANTIGGQDAVIKLHPFARPEDLLVRGAWPGIKFALGENPKRSNFRGPDIATRYPSTRMGVMESARVAFAQARDYDRKWVAWRALPGKEQARRLPPRRDLRLEAIAEILRGERRVHSHAYRQDEMLALVRLAESFGIRIATFQHALEGYKVADELARHGAGASTFSDWWAYKIEAYDAIPYNGALMAARGVEVSFNSDSDELARRLNLEAAKAVKYGGLEETEALAFVTSNPARQLGIGDRVGSLEPGKDADFVLWSGHPLSAYSRAEQTWVDGVREFDLGSDAKRRERIAAERARLLSALGEGKAEPTPSASGGPSPLPAMAPAWLDRQAGGPAVSIVGVTAHPVSGPVVENATVSFRDGRIVEVGPGLPPLPGAQVVDGKGLHAWPGMIDALSDLGLTEISSVAGSVDTAELGDLNPEIHAAIAVNPDAEAIPVTRRNGITHALVAPEGGLLSGTSAVIRLSGWTWEDLAATGPLALHVRWPSFRTVPPRPGATDAPSVDDQRRARRERIDLVKRTFAEARAYARAKTAGNADVNPAYEALLPVLDGRIPVVLHATEDRQIASALDWARDERVRAVLAGSRDVARHAGRLQRDGIPVIVPGVLELPAREDDPYDAAFRLPAELREAGVTFCIAGGDAGWAARNLPYHAAMAAAFGLDREAALRSVTLDAARVLGVDQVLGSLDPGKSASVVLTDGDLLEVRTHVLAVWVDGRPVDLGADRHERLYRRYRDRPAPR